MILFRRLDRVDARQSIAPTAGARALAAGAAVDLAWQAFERASVAGVDQGSRSETGVWPVAMTAARSGSSLAYQRAASAVVEVGDLSRWPEPGEFDDTMVVYLVSENKLVYGPDSVWAARLRA